MDKMLKIAVAGTGYVGLSIATLLAQHHEVCAIDVIPARLISSTGANLRSGTNTLKNTWPKRN